MSIASTASTVRSMTITSVLAATCLLGATPALAAGTPADTCASTIAKTLSKCVKKAVTAHNVCYKKTGAGCLTGDAKLTGAINAVPLGIQSKCPSTTVIADAGYGPLTTSALGAHFSDICRWQAKIIADRTFDADGSRYAAGDSTARKCMLTASKTAGKFLSGQLKGLSKCVSTGCTFDFAAAATDAATGLDSSCPGFAAAVGVTAAAYMSSTADQVAPSVQSPCDPMDATRCIFPFPNDLYTLPGAPTETGRQLAIGRKSVITEKTGGGFATSTVDTERWTEADGFSTGAMLLMNDTDIDLVQSGATPITDLDKTYDVNAPVLLLDADTGTRQLLWLERDSRGATVADQPIIGRVGTNLEEGHRYIVAMRNMKDGSGTALSAPAGFATYRDSTPTTVLPVEARRAHMEDILDTLTGFGIDRASLYLAWDFTTQSSSSASKRLLHMRDDAFTTLGATAPVFTVTSSFVNGSDPAIRNVRGTFQVPNYVQTAVAGTPLHLGADGLPVHTAGNFTANFSCTVPNTATAMTPARISMYGHGLLGSGTEVENGSGGNIRDFAKEHNIVFCGTDWTGFASSDITFVASVLADFTNFPTFIDRQHQGILNMLYLGRLMKHASGLAGDVNFQDGGQPIIDTSDLFYDGNSQGGILGGVLAAVAQDATRFSLGVPGMNYSTLLNRSTDFSEYDSIFAIKYPASTDRNLLLSMSQVIWDRTDPNGHVHHQMSDPYAGTPAKKLLCQVAFGDHQVAPVTMEVHARTSGLPIYKSTLGIVVDKPLPDVTPYYGIAALPALPFDGSGLVIWDSGNPPANIGNVPPDGITNMDPEWAALEACAQAGFEGDPHSCPRKDPDARIQKSAFLQTGGTIIDVCGGNPCEAQ
jgi:hypothetical protein